MILPSMAHSHPVCDIALYFAKSVCDNAVIYFDSEAAKASGCPKHAISDLRYKLTQALYQCVKRLGSHSRIADEAFAASVTNGCIYWERSKVTAAIKEKCANPGLPPTPRPNVPNNY